MPAKGSDSMTTFKSVYRTVDNLLRKWGERGVALSGETNDCWIFKGHIVEGDVLSGSCIIVSKDDGNMHLLNTGNPEDREVMYSAVIIER